jgi:uncharacterized membrane-anchored protein YitT (DUF2179 family)
MITMFKEQFISGTKVHSFMEYLYVLVGSAIIALTFNLFLLPNQIASGGVSGISTITYGLFQWKASYVQWAFNIPLFISGVIFLGKQFGAKTLVGTIFLPLVVYFSETLPPATTDPLLGALFGGIGVGVGLGIVFRGKASTGGTDLAAQIVHKYMGLSLGSSVLVIDGAIVIASALVFGIEKALYALVAMFLTGKMIDIVQLGLGYAKMAIIISSKEEVIRQAILTEIDRGVTKLSGYGGYTDDKRPVLMCVVSQNEVTKLKQLVQSFDPSAFVVVSNAVEVLGEGFKRN